MWPPQTAAASLPWASPRSLHLTPVGHIVSGWGQMQGAPSFGAGKRGGSARCNRSLVRSLCNLNPAYRVAVDFGLHRGIQ